MKVRLRDPVFWGKLMLALLALLPFARLCWAIAMNDLGPDPGKTVTRALGLAGLQLLIATLAMTPLRRWTGWRVWLRSRRMLGLFTLFYASLHLLGYLQFIAGWQGILKDVLKRPYITVGFAAFVLLVSMGITSTRGMMKRLGRNWSRLHKSIYAVAGLVWIHFLWQARSSIAAMVFYGVLLLVLLSVRLFWKWRSSQRSRLTVHRSLG